MQEIHDINLSYLMLAQQMIRDDKDVAVFRLGISQEIAEILGSLSTAQVMKLAGGPMMLTRFRFDDGAMLSMLTHDSKMQSMVHLHTSILLARQPVEEIC
ncbi:MAG: flagellar transcriptional regulator FlhD [Pseudomonadota bacterium]